MSCSDWWRSPSSPAEKQQFKDWKSNYSTHILSRSPSIGTVRNLRIRSTCQLPFYHHLDTHDDVYGVHSYIEMSYLMSGWLLCRSTQFILSCIRLFSLVCLCFSESLFAIKSDGRVIGYRVLERYNYMAYRLTKCTYFLNWFPVCVVLRTSVRLIRPSTDSCFIDSPRCSHG